MLAQSWLIFFSASFQEAVVGNPSVFSTLPSLNTPVTNKGQAELYLSKITNTVTLW